MARASIAYKDAVESSLGFNEGNGEIVDAAIVIHKLSDNKATGESYDPRCALRLMIQRLNKDFEATDDAPIEEMISIGALNKFRPGQADGPNDEDPKDLCEPDGDGNISAADMEASGNAIFCVEGAHIDTKAKIAMFSKRLEECGFKSEYLTGFAPHLIGTRGHLKQEPMPKGADYKGKRDPMCLVFDKVIVKGYEAKKFGKTAVKESNRAATASSKANGKAKDEPAGDTGDSDGDDEVRSIAAGMFSKIDSALRGPEPVTVNPKKIAGKLTLLLSSEKVPSKLHKGVQDLFKLDNDWFTELADASDWKIKGDAITIPAVQAA